MEGEGVAFVAPDMAKYCDGSDQHPSIDSGTQQVATKLLVSNAIAGSVIGKAGANIEQLQRSSGARIQLSRAGEFYPGPGFLSGLSCCQDVRHVIHLLAAGTSDRVLLLSGMWHFNHWYSPAVFHKSSVALSYTSIYPMRATGCLHSVLTAIFLILEKVSRDAASSQSRNGRPAREDEREDEVKLALSRRLCGLLIGHKGQTVRDFISDSGATIRVQSLAELTPSDPERTIAVTGARDQVLRAVALVLNTLSMHEGFASYMETTLQLATNQGVVLPLRSSTTKSVLTQVRASLTLWLPNDDVGAILGRKGQHLVEIQQSARVTIKISDRAKMENNEREVSITGMYGAVKLAEAMVSEKLNQSRARAAREEGGPSGVPRDE
ncbi:uncharacterized protein HaLaN_14532, partial [Haematococcus lacustris]